MATSFMNKSTSQKAGKYALLAIAMVAGFSLSACSMNEPTKMVQQRAVVEEQLYQQEFFLAQLDPYTVSLIGDKYDNHGDGPAGITFFYDPASDKKAKKKADEDIANLSSNLKKAGVENIVSRVVPVEGLHHSKVLIEFNTFTASAPEGCPYTMEQVNDEHILNYRDYGLGCSIETYMASQVDNPKDLTGRDGIGVQSARRVTNVIEEQYVSGQRNDALDGERTTE